MPLQYVIRWMPPPAVTNCGIVDGGRRRTHEAQAVQVITVGLDIAESWFQAQGLNDRGQVVLRKKLARS